MYLDLSSSLSLDFGRKRLSEADILELVAASEEHIEPIKGPMGFTRNEEP